MSEMGMADLLRHASGEGWEGLDNIEAQFKANNAKMGQVQLERAQAIVAELEGAPNFMAWLEETTIRRPGWLGASGEHLMKVATYGLFRDGQNSIWWAVQNMVALVRGEKPTEGT